MKLKIFSINMWLLPFRLSRDNGARVKRLDCVIKKLDPDIVCIQEVWGKKHLKYLERSFKDYFFNYDLGRMKVNSGLVIMSKRIPEARHFYMFPKPRSINRIDKFASKGILVSEFERLIVYNTHLYHKTDDERINIAFEEFRILKKKVEDSSSDKIKIVCGDMNLKPGPLDKINQGFFTRIDTDEMTFSYENPYIKKWWDPKMIADKKIDYILFRGTGGKEKPSFSSRLIKENLSDHYGIFTEIEII